MNYPLISEYVEAIKSPEDNFDKLRHLRPVLDADGNPFMSGGNFAVVFKMTDGEKDYAIKCFTREQDDRLLRYKEIDKELSYVSSPFILKTKFLDKELFVDSNRDINKEFPVVIMEWVDGKTLDAILMSEVDSKEYYNLAYQFSKLACWMIAQPFAHGDIKPDNIIVKADGRFTLIDYDGMFVPALCRNGACENGTPGFVHPNRTILDYNERIDDFSLVVIEISLLLLAHEPNWIKNNNNGSLVFQHKDFYNIKECKIYRDLIYYRTDHTLRPLIDLFFRMLKNESIRREELYCLAIPQYSTLTTDLIQGSSAIPLLGDILWKIAINDTIKSVNLNDKILELYSPSDYDGYVRIMYDKNSNQYEIVASENYTTCYVSLTREAIRNILISVELWDNSLSNKIDLITQ